MHDRAGGLYERMGLIQPAMDAYRRGHAYRQAASADGLGFRGLGGLGFRRLGFRV